MIISSLSMYYTVKQVKFELSDCREERQPYQKATKAANVSPGIWRLLDRNRCSFTGTRHCPRKWKALALD